MPRGDDKVIWINEYENSDSIEVLDIVKERFKTGQYRGLIMAIDEGVGDDGREYHGVVSTGSYRRNPVQGRAIAGALFDFFAKLARPFKKPGKL